MAFVSSVPVPTISATGCAVPDFASIYAGLVSDFQGIYGTDAVLDPASLDGQWLGILATAFKNYVDSFLACYNAFSPATAQGAGLSSVVKVNGISRDAASYSTVDIVNIGQAGRTIVGPQIRDQAGNLWTMPDFAIPFSGSITVTATCTIIGAVLVPAGSASGDGGFWSIAAPQLGWQSVSNPSAASPGAPVEGDAALRVRQGLSVALSSQTVLDGIVADILTIPGVTRAKAYENDSDITDANDIPAHGTAFVIDGGDAAAIAQAIALKKTQGSPTYGTATQTVLVGKAQVPRQIQFFRPVEPIITYNVTVATLPGYTLDTRAAIQQALADFTNEQGIGGSNGIIAINDTYEPVLGVSIGGARPFKVKSITMARGGTVTQAADLPIAFYEAPLGIAANVNVAEVSS